MVNQRARDHLIDFCIATNPKYEPNWHHEEIANELEKAENGTADWKILILMMPPRHGKSELATINFPAWYLGRGRDREIITVSYSEELALDFGGKTRAILQDDPYQHIFGIGLKKDEQAKAKWQTSLNGSYTSVGVGGSLTGRGANLLVVDDPLKNRKEAESKLIRDSQWSWFTSTAFTRLEPNAKTIIILTRWHYDDIAGRIMANTEMAKYTKIIKYPALSQENRPLWPNRYGYDELIRIKNSIGIYDWSCLYQQEPIISEAQEFKQEWFQSKTWEEVRRTNTRNFLTIDTAMSKGQGADYTGFCINFVDYQNKWNIKAWRLRLNARELMEYLFTLQDQYQFEKIGIEKTAYTIGIKPFLDEEQRKRNKFLPLMELEHNQVQKELRIRALVPRYSTYSVFHIENECKDLEDELLTFPFSIHDDISDAMAYQLQIAEMPFAQLINNTHRNGADFDPYEAI